MFVCMHVCICVCACNACMPTVRAMLWVYFDLGCVPTIVLDVEIHQANAASINEMDAEEDRSTLAEARAVP